MDHAILTQGIKSSDQAARDRRAGLVGPGDRSQHQKELLSAIAVFVVAGIDRKGLNPLEKARGKALAVPPIRSLTSPSDQITCHVGNRAEINFNRNRDGTGGEKEDAACQGCQTATKSFFFSRKLTVYQIYASRRS
jgi:hypothetical protein